MSEGADADADTHAGSDMGPILFYDGTCGFCSGMVQFILRHERRDTLRFATLQGEHGQRILQRHPELAGLDSAVWYEPREQRVAARSAAALAVLAYLGGPWSLLRAGRLLPAAVRDRLYDFVARHRQRVLRNKEASCRVPDPARSHRFLDDPAESTSREEPPGSRSRIGPPEDRV